VNQTGAFFQNSSFLLSLLSTNISINSWYIVLICNETQDVINTAFFMTNRSSYTATIASNPVLRMKPSLVEFSNVESSKRESKYSHSRQTEVPGELSYHETEAYTAESTSSRILVESCSAIALFTFSGEAEG
jgi:hypothetical protein